MGMLTPEAERRQQAGKRRWSGFGHAVTDVRLAGCSTDFVPKPQASGARWRSSANWSRPKQS
jgi:hypothetical protein